MYSVIDVVAFLNAGHKKKKNNETKQKQKKAPYTF